MNKMINYIAPELLTNDVVVEAGYVVTGDAGEGGEGGELRSILDPYEHADE